MGKKGKGFSHKGKPEIWDEIKSVQVKATVTPTARQLLKELLGRIGLSLAEFLEYLARGLLVVSWKEFTIAELVQQHSLEELAAEAHIIPEELEEISKGERPSDTALIRLGGLLSRPIPNQKVLSTDELLQIRSRTTFASKKPKVGNGHGNS